VRASVRRADFGTIPDVKQAWDTFGAAVRSRKRADAEEALQVFRVTAHTSPDLVSVDARRLVQVAEETMKSAFAVTFQKELTGAPADLPELGDLSIYN
jgi:hypothetical protein